jgi:hypothetical protein
LSYNEIFNKLLPIHPILSYEKNDNIASLQIFPTIHVDLLENLPKKSHVNTQTSAFTYILLKPHLHMHFLGTHTHVPTLPDNIEAHLLMASTTSLLLYIFQGHDNQNRVDGLFIDPRSTKCVKKGPQ